jgi:signal transduction histidine kinase
MAFWKQIRTLFFPRRASTQTWMMLTFAGFVGGAVLVVGLYTFLGLRGQVHEAAQETLRDQARYLALQIEAANPQELLETLREISGVTPYRIGVATPDSVLWETEDRRIVSDRGFLQRPEVRQALAEGFGFAEREEDGQPVLYAAVYRPVSGLIVRIAQVAPPMYTVTQRIMATLIIGMALALVLSLLGAWVAAKQVTSPLRVISQRARRVADGDLEHQIAVRTRAAEVQDLAKSLNAMAERFRRDIFELQRMTQIQNEFIGNVSHEVKNPIFAVGGYLEALASTDLTEEQRQKYATKGLTNLQRLNSLFTDLIEIAKLEYRPDAVQPEIFDLQELIGEVAEMLERKAEAKGIALSYENRPLETMADRSRIRQVLINLIDNAIAYADEGTVRCRMRRHRDKIRIEVVDNGRGIPEEHLDRIFERFYRVDAARSRARGGTGLGLAIVKQILQAHGETIHVESTAGRGTRFWFELPLAEEDAHDGGAVPSTVGDDLELPI